MMCGPGSIRPLAREVNEFGVCLWDVVEKQPDGTWLGIHGWGTPKGGAIWYYDPETHQEMKLSRKRSLYFARHEREILMEYFEFVAETGEDPAEYTPYRYPEDRKRYAQMRLDRGE